MPLVSIVMPAYNHALYVDEAVRSVLGQSLRDFELIACDDGSSDGTAAVLAKHAEQDPRMTFVEHEDGANHGLVATLAVCIERARAPFVATIASDDRWHSERLAKQLPAVPGGGWSYCVPRVVNAGGSPTYCATGWSSASPDLTDLLVWNSIPAPGVIFARELFDRVGGFTDCDFEDWSLWLRMRASCAPTIVPEHLVDYRFLQSSLFRTILARGQLFQGAVSVIDDCLALATLAPGQRELVERYRRGHRTLWKLVNGRPASEAASDIRGGDELPLLKLVSRYLEPILDATGVEPVLSLLGNLNCELPETRRIAQALAHRAWRSAWIWRPTRRVLLGSTTSGRRSAAVRRALGSLAALRERV